MEGDGTSADTAARHGFGGLIQETCVRIRTFRNSDPPAIARIWNRLSPLRGRARGLTPQSFESLVFAKPYFDPLGMFLLEDGDELLGFAHAGFGPDAQGGELSTELGVTCMLVLDPQRATDGGGPRLLEACETYLRDRGAKVLYGGQIAPLTPFYQGMYGGSEMPGVLRDDRVMGDILCASGYREIDRVCIMQMELPQATNVDRKQMLVKRRFRVEAVEESRPLSWWEVCSEPIQEAVHFQVFANQGGPAQGCVSCWVIEPLMHTWNQLTVGLTQMWIENASRRQGLATLLTTETLRQLAASGIQRVEVQVMSQNKPARALYEKIGFRAVDEGIIYRKETA